jgi:phosphohistidine phosphatase
MKKLTLIRHGKAAYEFGLSDKKRPLTETGIENTILVAQKFASHLPVEYTLFSSTAIRAMETAKTFVRTLKMDESKIIYNDDLYTFDSSELENSIKSIPNEVNNILFFGHNEAITNFVNKFGTINIDNVPTSGLVTIEFDSESWSVIKKGKTIKTLFPSQLK